MGRSQWPSPPVPSPQLAPCARSPSVLPLPAATPSVVRSPQETERVKAAPLLALSLCPLRPFLCAPHPPPPTCHWSAPQRYSNSRVPVSSISLYSPLPHRCYSFLFQSVFPFGHLSCLSVRCGVSELVSDPQLYPV